MIEILILGFRAAFLILLGAGGVFVAIRLMRKILE